MKKKIIIILLILLIFTILLFLLKPKNKKGDVSVIEATILEVSNNHIKISDSDNVIYTFVGDFDNSLKLGENAKIEYSGKLNKNKELQSVNVISVSSYTENNGIPISWNDNGIFSEFYDKAYKKINMMSLEEKIGQIFLVRLPDENKIADLKKYKFGGYLLFEKDFKNKTKEEVIKMIDEFNKNSNISLLIATDEEGGKVSRLSSNTNLVSTPFRSPSELYQEGGMEAIRKDTIYKTEVLEELGINVNLAPVIDVSTDPNSYMYERTIKQDTSITSSYAKTVIKSSLGSKVSYTLKHFPGYGNNADTHNSSATDNRTYSALMEDDIPPFKAGIKEGAEAILFAHTIVPALDKDNPSSLSATTHNVLRNELGFTGISITDDLDMGAITDNDAIVKAILAGNDLIIVTDYEKAISKVKNAVNNGNLSEEIISKMAFRIIAWKYYKGLMYNIEK